MKTRPFFAWFKSNRSLWIGLASLIMLFALVSVAHADARVFTLRYDVLLPGANLKQIGNTLMTCSGSSTSCTNAKNASGNTVNDELNMQFVDLDGVVGTTSSSSATLSGLPAAANLVILHAQLYWGGVFQPQNASGQTDANKIKFRQGNGSYTTITADNYNWDDISNGGTARSYGATADITNLFPASFWVNGAYWGADVKATTGCTNGGGCADGAMGNYAGWSLLLVYQNTSESTIRYVGINDGLQCVYTGCSEGGSPNNVTFTGFNIPVSPVDQRWGMLVWDGDLGIDDDSLQLQGNTQSNTLRDSDNYFRGAISVNNTIVTARNPNDNNTLGIDIVENTGSSFSGTSITASFRTSGDIYVAQYFWIVSQSAQVDFDYGDAPSSYGSASHQISGNNSPTALRMGATVTDTETGMQNAAPHTTDALGDDSLGTTPDDETGIATFPPFTTQTTSYCVDVSVTNNFGIFQVARLYGWLDFNHDGDFDTNEFVQGSNTNNGNTNVIRPLCWNSFATVPAGTNLYMRLRLTTATLTSAQATGAATNGEVEDYRIVVTTPTAAHLGTFRAVPSKKQVKLLWNTGSELDVNGFYLWRSTSKDGKYTKVNDDLILAKKMGSADGADYSFKNKKLKPNKVYWYKIEVVGRNGTLETSDPLKVKTKPKS